MIKKGIGVSSGIAEGKVFKLEEINVEITQEKGDSKVELKKFKDAIELTIKQITNIKEKASGSLKDEELLIFDAHIQLAQDPTMVSEIETLINNNSDNAIFATDEVMKKYITMFESMDDEYMRERAADIKDISKRVLANIAGVTMPDISAINEAVIIVADDLTPSETAQINKEFVKGFVTNIGGKTSHAAIMARSLEVPAVLGLKDITEQAKDGDLIAMNGREGIIYINPNKEELKLLAQQEKDFELEKEEIKEFIGKKSLTTDNHEVELAANIGQPVDIELANKNDAEGVGLFRSEFLYMDAKDWPDEETQFNAYKTVLEGMKNKRVVIRTLDIGGDKILSYFKFPEELNPFLGYRAIRLTMDKKDIFEVQIRAMLRASAFGKLAIMFPMVATIDELKDVKAFVKSVEDKLLAEGVKIGKYELGTMIEIPAAAVIADKIAKHVDFLSIGTNDLMQYSMAADRMNDKVSYLYQPLNPAILKLIKMTIDGGHKENIWVGMCGEMAGDRDAIPILLGLGLDEFSMSAPSILKARRLISKWSYKEAKELADSALDQETQKDVENLIKERQK